MATPTGRSLRAPTAILLLGAPFAALAQDPAPDAEKQLDIEYRIPETAPTEKKVTTKYQIESEWVEGNNIDFRYRDESSDQAVLDSDDRFNFAFTGVRMDLAYAFDPKVTFGVSASYRGLWGQDQIGLASRFGGFLYLNELDLAWAPGGKVPKVGEEIDTVVIRVGRFTHNLGGIGKAPDFVLADVLDGVRIQFPLGPLDIDLTPMTVLSGVPADLNINFLSFIGQTTPSPYNFRGNIMTRRSGVVVAADRVSDVVKARAYAFYTDIGASGSGADISYNGELGNFIDNDWVMNYGLRANATFGPALVWAELAGSGGIDRKELVASDVNSNGLAWGAGLQLATGDPAEDDTEIGVDAMYWEAQGPAYLDNGLMYSHGYVSMKGRQVGGLITDRTMGWHPSAYVGMWGVENTVHNVDRRSGTRVISVRPSLKLANGFEAYVGYYYLGDTAFSALDLADLPGITPPYGYAREEFAAQARVGKTLGQEIDVGASFTATKQVTVYVRGGVLLPGAFYATTINRVAGNQLGGDATAWLGTGGLRAEF